MQATHVQGKGGSAQNTAEGEEGEEEGIPIWNESGEVGGRVGNGNFEATRLRKVIAFDSGQL